MQARRATHSTPLIRCRRGGFLVGEMNSGVCCLKGRDFGVRKLKPPRTPFVGMNPSPHPGSMPSLATIETSIRQSRSLIVALATVGHHARLFRISRHHTHFRVI